MSPDENDIGTTTSSRRWRIAAIARLGLTAIALWSAANSIAQEAPAPDDKNDLFIIGGRVLDPDGKPLAGAKLYALVESAESKPPRLKDPNQKVFEVIEREGKPPLLKFVHPKIVELMTTLGIGPILAADDPRLRNPEVEKGMARLLPEIYETHPAMSPVVRMTTMADGRFRFGIPKSELKAPFEADVSVIAVGDGYAPAWNMSK
ncbi:MAG TPA: hypothetical protein VGZ26_12635, partial [Pirellulales bacterium]|nr:hypothetical protein [Pirellulales bacterium]